MKIEDLNVFYWLLATFSLIAYIIFLRGLYYLRIVARFLLSNEYFSGKTITNLKNSGNHFLITGIISFGLLAAFSLNTLTDGSLNINYDANFMIPFFLAIIGMFFIIQANTLALARKIKEENELTI